MTLSPPRRSGPADEAMAPREHPRERSGTATADEAEDARRPTRSRRRKRIRAAAGPRPHRPEDATGTPPDPEAVSQWTPVTAPDPGPQWPPTGRSDAAPPLPPAAAPVVERARSTAAPDPVRPGHARPPSESVAELVDRLAANDVVDADDVVGEMAALGMDDETARARYGMSLHGLGVSVLTHLRHRRVQKGLRRAPSTRPYLSAALLRCALYLGPLSVAVAAARPLGRAGWVTPVATLVLGWTAAQALTSLGGTVARTTGTAAAARLVAGGFATAGGLWCAFVWVAPAAWLGPDRMLAGVIGAGGLTALATVTAALVTRAEADVVRWSLPCWLLAALSVAAAVHAVGDLPIETLLPAAIVVAAVRAYRPVIGRSVPRRKPLVAADVRRAAGYLVAGAGQAVCVALLWRAGPAGVTSPAAIPLLLAVPALETLVGWHMYQIEHGLDATETSRDYRRHVRSVAVATVAALLPPLAAGIALAAAAYRLPNGAAVRDGVLALAAGTLLAGLLAATFLLAARGRTGTAATLAAAAPLAIMAVPLLTPTLAPLPAIVAVVAGTHLLALLTVAHIAADHRRAP